jgi:hypothetical protein
MTVVTAPTVSNSEATTAQDIARRAIASKSAHKDEHDVEKADPVFAGLAVEYLLDDEQADTVTVITADRLAREAIETATTALEYDGQVSTITLWNLIDSEDDDLTLI